MSRQSCLFVMSTAIEGVSAQSFIQAFTLAQNNFNIQLASPNGKPVEYIHLDDTSRRWLNEFRSKSSSLPAKLEAVDAAQYGCLVIPDSPGAVHDLSHSIELANIVNYFISEKKPICAIGMGVAGLCSRRQQSKSWQLNNYSMTATSVYELARTPYFGSISLIPEDFIKDNGGRYAASDPDEVHVVLDRHLITAQNTASTYMAIQTLVLLVNQRHGKATV